MIKKSLVKYSHKAFLLLCLATCLLYSTIANAQISADSLIFPRLPVDLGVVAEGDTVFTEFIVVNKYNDTVSIQQIKGTCGCTVPEYGKQILVPNDSLIVTFFFKSKGFKHDVIKHILILSSKGEAIYTFKVFVKPEEQ